MTAVQTCALPISPRELAASNLEVVRQFMEGHPDGPVPFHYPASDYHEQLLADDT